MASLLGTLKRSIRYSLYGALIIILAVVGYLCMRPLLAQTIDLESYNAATDRTRYSSLPYRGKNFRANSWLGFAAGRYYLKTPAAASVVAAYNTLARTHPELFFLYGEMGWKWGGSFYPHKTHRDGLSADFLTPVRIVETGKPALLPGHLANGWGYYLRLDSKGCYGAESSKQTYCLDTGAMIAHLDALQKATKAYDIKIRRVIFDPPLLKILRQHPDFRKISSIPFMEKKAWFPHDGHYHVDFSLR